LPPPISPTRDRIRIGLQELPVEEEDVTAVVGLGELTAESSA